LIQETEKERDSLEFYFKVHSLFSSLFSGDSAKTSDRSERERERGRRERRENPNPKVVRFGQNLIFNSY